jgi:hypothetical protein
MTDATPRAYALNLARGRLTDARAHLAGIRPEGSRDYASKGRAEELLRDVSDALATLAVLDAQED